MKKLTALALPLLALLWTGRAASARVSGPTVPLCQGITLSASYLAQAVPGQGPGFLFTLENGTDRAIRLAEPVPSSSHWFASTHGRWLWRASNGAGGSLTDAENERGRMFAFQPAAPLPDGGKAAAGAKDSPRYMEVPAHQSREWIESDRENPVLEYKPSCRSCNYPGERQYRVVFAYAYVPAPGEPSDGLLPCGLRSKPVDMPPKLGK